MTNDGVDEETIALEETGWRWNPKKRRKRVNAFMDGDEDAIDYNDDDPEDGRSLRSRSSSFHMMKKIQMMKRVKPKLRCWNQWNRTDDLGEGVELLKKATKKRILKTRKKNIIRRGWDKSPSLPPFLIVEQTQWLEGSTTLISSALQPYWPAEGTNSNELTISVPLSFCLHWKKWRNGVW